MRSVFAGITRNSISFFHIIPRVFLSCRRNFQHCKICARAIPRRLENVKNHLAMFHLDERDGTTKYDSSSSLNKENFGWWLYDRDREIVMSPASNHNKDHRSSESSCVNSDESDSHSFVQNVSRQEHESEIGEKIELTSFAEDYLDVDLIEQDISEKNKSATYESEGNDCEESKFGAVCYTPERLIRSQKYRILIPSPRYLILSQASFTPGNESTEQQSHRRRLSCLIDSKNIGSARLKELLNVSTTDKKEYTISSPIFRVNECTPKMGENQCTADDFNPPIKPNEDSLNQNEDRDVQSAETISNNSSSSSRLSYDRLNSTWDDCKGSITHLSSLEDTSGIQSNDWSMETPSDTTQNTPMSLCDELGIISRRHTPSFRNNQGVAINEVMSILEGLPSDAEKAMVLLEEEDRFYDSMSSHDQLTRLALTIEIDTEETLTVPDDTNNWIQHLRDKIERLQLANKEIHKDICTLHTNFQCDGKKITDLSSNTTEMLEELHELRYLDDLLELLEGELEQISKRNWPFILGHSNPREEMNLII
ncbi:hypothetical protein DMN91_006247 [Ooceraea biroi]|uniref:Uncharacterized protein n=1 Tax=Ooceraea biroi TaxID=2015173 RepID=A0A3L8DN59_OOCBI|nr:hypothetical protein DMN91_006247 [Ooceraea biroi]